MSVEFAAALPAVALALGAVLAATTLGVDAVRAQQAAWLGARAAAVTTDAAGLATAREASSGARVTLDRDESWITVRVQIASAWGLVVSGSATARDEG